MPSRFDLDRYHFRVYVGPTTVQQWAAILRATAMPWQAVTIEGTEHIHIAIAAAFLEAAETESLQWLRRAGMQAYVYQVNYLRKDVA